MGVKIKRNMPKIVAKIEAGRQAMVEAVTESVVEYGNIFVREDQGTLKDSALIASRPKEGLAIWDTPYAKRMYYTGTPSKDKNPDASLQWAKKGVDTHKKELNQVAQNAFKKGMEKTSVKSNQSALKTIKETIKEGKEITDKVIDKTVNITNELNKK